MPHPFFSARRYPWSREDARDFHVALYQTIESQATIRLLYRQSGGDTPLQDANAVLMWKEALEHLTTARKLDQLCTLILEKPAWKAIHDVVSAVVNAEGPVEEIEQQEPEPPRPRRIAPYALAAFAGLALLVTGFVLLRPASTFPLTVYVHGPAGVHDLPLRNEGAVLLDLGGDRRREPIGDRGQAFFPAIPGSFRGEKVDVAVVDAAFQRVDDSRLALDGTSLYVKVQRKPARIRGYVQDGNGHPIAGATISVAGLSANSRGDGRFELVLSPDLIENALLLRVTAEGYQPWTHTVVPDGAEITAVMQR
jgi:hypothetical protein